MFYTDKSPVPVILRHTYSTVPTVRNFVKKPNEINRWRCKTLPFLF